MKNLLLLLFNHERYQSISVIAACLMLLWFFGCPSQCPSILDPAKKVNAIELKAELDFLISKAESGRASIAQQEHLKNLVLQQAILASQTGTINPVALFSSIGAILGTGAVIDNVRKRKEIKSMSDTTG